jgi:hypothetical protein
MALSELDYVGIIVPIVSLAVAVFKLYLDQRKARREIEMSKQGIMIYSGTSGKRPYLSSKLVIPILPL